jgi:tRNA 5-methylaminomethyl-2-thiouridine biosynthesis bifunctional protein
MATAFASESLLNPLLTRPLPLQAVRGQVTWGTAPLGYPSSLPTYPVHGHGSLIPRIGTAGDSDDSAPRWVLGSTYERDVADLPPTADQVALANEANLARLGKLLPDFAALATLATPPPHHAFVGIRCSTRDRLPVLGQIASHPGLWISSGMGSRGLTFAVLCAELLAAQWHGEPWPIERTLAEKLDPVRLFKTSQPHDG